MAKRSIEERIRDSEQKIQEMRTRAELVHYKRVVNVMLRARKLRNAFDALGLTVAGDRVFDAMGSVITQLRDNGYVASAEKLTEQFAEDSPADRKPADDE